MAEAAAKPGAFIVVYPDGPFPMAKKVADPAWSEFQRLASGKEIPLIAASYQALLAIASEVAAPEDLAVLRRLKSWVLGKVETVGSAA